MKAVSIFAGFCKKYIGRTNADVASDTFQHAAYRNGRIRMGSEKDLRDHGSSGSLPVSAADSDGLLIVLHDLPQKFRSGKGGDIPAKSFCQFRDCLCGLPRYKLPDQYHL